MASIFIFIILIINIYNIPKLVGEEILIFEN